MSRRVVVCLPLLVLAGCLEKETPTVADTAHPVQVMRVALAPAAETRSYPGVIRPRHEAAIGFRASGRIAERLVDVGDRVREGQVLARLDPADLALALRSTAADLASAEAQETQATAEAARSATLVKLGHVSLSDDDQKQSAARVAKQRTQSALSALQLAQNRIHYAELRAPSAGAVTAIVADQGTVVAEGAPVLRLAEAGVPEAEIAVPETAVADLRAAKASVSLWAKPGVTLPATLREIAPQADAGLRTYAARFALPNPPDWITLGMTATVRLSVSGGPPVAEIPASALIDRGDGPGVWLAGQADGVPHFQRVTVSGFRQDRVLVAGLPDGAMIVTVGVQKLDPGAKIRIADIRPAGE